MDVKLSYQSQSFCGFEVDENNRNCKLQIDSLIKLALPSMEDVFNTLNLSDDDEIFREYTALIELYNALKLKTMLILFKRY